MQVSTIRRTIADRRQSLGGDLSKGACDGILRMLALTLPRAGMSPADAHDMLEFNFRLLRKAGMTDAMLRDAAERYVMRPNGGKPKYFPDPGQLAELAADDIRARKRALVALERAEKLLADPAAGDAAVPETGGKLRSLADVLRGLPGRRPAPPAAAPANAAAAKASRDPAAVERLRVLRPQQKASS